MEKGFVASLAYAFLRNAFFSYRIIFVSFDRKKLMLRNVLR